MNNEITIVDVRFVAKQSDIANTLFERNKSGTAYGYYRKGASSISLYRADGTHVATINKHQILCKVSSIGGKKHYSLSCPDFLSAKRRSEDRMYREKIRQDARLIHESLLN